MGTFGTNLKDLKYEFCVVSTFCERVQFFCVQEERAGEMAQWLATCHAGMLICSNTVLECEEVVFSDSLCILSCPQLAV